MITVLHSKIAIKRNIEKEKEGSIFIPEAFQEPSQSGIVVAVGPGDRNQRTGEITPLFINIGDTVFFGKNNGHNVSVDDEEYTILNQSEVLGYIKGESL